MWERISFPTIHWYLHGSIYFLSLLLSRSLASIVEFASLHPNIPVSSRRSKTYFLYEMKTHSSDRAILIPKSIAIFLSLDLKFLRQIAFKLDIPSESFPVSLCHLYCFEYNNLTIGIFNGHVICSSLLIPDNCHSLTESNKIRLSEIV